MAALQELLVPSSSRASSLLLGVFGPEERNCHIVFPLARISRLHCFFWYARAMVECVDTGNKILSAAGILFPVITQKSRLDRVRIVFSVHCHQCTSGRCIPKSRGSRRGGLPAATAAMEMGKAGRGSRVESGILPFTMYLSQAGEKLGRKSNT